MSKDPVSEVLRSAKRAALFLDRDGVINRDRPDYVKCWEEFEFMPGILVALSRLAKFPAPVIVISNQAGIGRRLMTEAGLGEIHRRMREAIEVAGGRIDDLFCCPHHPDAGCDCRKPKPGLLLRAAEAHDLRLRDSVLIGDDWRDMQAAKAAGVKGILLRSPKSARPRPADITDADFVWAEDVMEAARLAASTLQHGNRT